ncbi:MAG: 16S rRNA (cytidine(1402)-2'-O)-methyltransferase [Schwartzia sp.]|nr:16S rRNA (cytidine(1402)-2'-O)-methyltransferase [Schwartzia sp. (in: firmicutes)]
MNDKGTDAQKKRGVLYLCATPIGNLGDMTFRAVKVLTDVPLIAAEDTRRTRELLAHFDIHTRLTSYHEHNKMTKGRELIDWLLDGNDLACVSDAGMPAISDPGAELARDAIAHGINVVPVPGASAALTALIASGLDTSRFSFVGFLPPAKAKSRRRELLDEIKTHGETLIFYEAPHHLKATLGDILGALGDREAALCRELTKKFEEFRRGTLSSLIETLDENESRGEFVIVVSGAKGVDAPREAAEKKSPAEMVGELIKGGMTKKDAMRETAKKLNMSRRDVYREVMMSGE